MKHPKHEETSSNTGEGPVTSALRNALTKRVNSLNQQLLAIRDQGLPEEQLKVKAAECLVMAKGINELAGWTYAPRRPLRIVEAVEYARAMCNDCGLSEDDLTWVFEIARKKGRGRPAKTRHAYIKALELRLNEPTKSWMDVARQLCHCERRQHGLKCSDNIRRGVILLKKFLNKYDISIEKVE